MKNQWKPSSGFALGKSLGSRGAKPMAAGNLSRFPSTLENSFGLRSREISRVSGNLSAVGDGFPNTSLVLVKQGYIPSFLQKTFSTIQTSNRTVSQFLRCLNKVALFKMVVKKINFRCKTITRLKSLASEFPLVKNTEQVFHQWLWVLHANVLVDLKHL